ncbi:MAG: 4Fe-4S binding protein [Deltaproteobacteria bacterium]|nr:4Fe-4S binding protein [Deltaproteobacteria bacterium]MBW1961793.1 4Fe-4S binding protein [Deltaproteobacteria bacterium]MBW1993454.1 4Fe-4S binding protein [Deltaproteobacteria bacterium]MBW2152460.1 4Fe-4S binding protein [Deltaproteobacteria bacterium]
MKIDQELCIGCGQCLPYCPVDAISLEDDLAEIDFEECAECGNCLRMASCPVDAIYQQELVWPRTVRSILSDPLTIAEESGISGRGTEEMKTNEVTGRFKLGSVGIGIEVGRPITGARFYDVEKVAQAVAKLGVEFEKINPTTSLMSDPSTGKFKDDILNEKVLSAILEFPIKLEKLPELFDVLKKVSDEIDCVFSLDVATRIAPDGSVPTDPFIKASGLWLAPNGKTNVGLGRPRYKEDLS